MLERFAPDFILRHECMITQSLTLICNLLKIGFQEAFSIKQKCVEDLDERFCFGKCL